MKIRDNPETYLRQGLVLCILGAFLIGLAVFTPIIAFTPFYYYYHHHHVDSWVERCFSATLSVTNPVANESLPEFWGTQLNLGGFYTNGTPVTIRVYSIDGSVNASRTHVTNATVELLNFTFDIYYEAIIIEVHREGADVRFGCWLIGINELPPPPILQPVRLDILIVGLFFSVIGSISMISGLKRWAIGRRLLQDLLWKDS